MSAPKRIQRQRTKGYRLPPDAIYVGRPSLWGNPYSLDDVRAMFPEVPVEDRAAAAVRLYGSELEHWGLMSDFGWHVSDARWDAIDAEITASGAKSMADYARVVLRGHDLACWCPLDQPCHGDTLLELANR